MGVGISNKNPSMPERIMSYQLGVNICPHITEKNSCKIYEKRPLICRAFPLISLGQIGVTIATPQQCLFVEKTEREHGSFDSILPMTPKKFKAHGWEVVGAIGKKIDESLIQSRLSGEIVWKFDLKSNKWFRI